MVWMVEKRGLDLEEAMKNLAENALPQIGEYLADMWNQAREGNGFKDVVYLAEKLKDDLEKLKTL